MFYYDFITATKNLKSDVLQTQYLSRIKEVKSESYNLIHYELKIENTPLDIYHYPEYNKVTIKGSLPYFLLGHNYSISLEQEMGTIEYISNVLETDIFKFTVVNVEVGCVIESPFTINSILNSHIKIKGMKTKSYSNGKYFEDSNVISKIYDFQKNIKSKVSKNIRSELEKSSNYSGNKTYVKIENKYKRPEISVKHRGLLIQDLFDIKFIEFFKNDLLDYYNSILKTGSVLIENKKQLSLPSICLIALKKLEDIGDYNTTAVVKEIIKSYTDILSKDDQKARIRQLFNSLKKIELKKCEFDLSELLIKSMG